MNMKRILLIMITSLLMISCNNTQHCNCNCNNTQQDTITYTEDICSGYVIKDLISDWENANKIIDTNIDYVYPTDLPIDTLVRIPWTQINPETNYKEPASVFVLYKSSGTVSITDTICSVEYLFKTKDDYLKFIKK